MKIGARRGLLFSAFAAGLVATGVHAELATRIVWQGTFPYDSKDSASNYFTVSHDDAYAFVVRRQRELGAYSYPGCPPAIATLLGETDKTAGTGLLYYGQISWLIDYADNSNCTRWNTVGIWGGVASYYQTFETGPVEDNTCKTANPVQPGTGRKRQSQIDYQGAGAHPLTLERHYNSRWMDSATARGMSPVAAWGGGWRHNYHASLTLRSSTNALRAYRPDGTIVALTPSATVADTWTAPNGDSATARFDAGGQRIGFTYKALADDSTETYDLAGKLLSSAQRNGWTTTLSYSDVTTPAAVAPNAGLLTAVRNHFGRELRFTYDAQGRVLEVLPPGAMAGQPAGSAVSPIRYQYEEAASRNATVPAQGQLTSVTWQDGTLRRYHYEDGRWPQGLTGITDEAGVRYGTYAYDDQGRVTRSELAGGTERLDFAYATDASGKPTTTVTDYASGSAASRGYTFADIGNVRYPISVSAPCSLCGSTQQQSSYDTAGNPTKQIAHDGSVTFIAYDTKGRETERATFASSYASATTRPALANATKVISTKWHAIWMLPTQVAEPNKTTANTYNSKGLLTGTSWTATTDATGAAKFSATKTGSTYATGYGYNSNNIVTSAVRKTDAIVVAQTTYTVNAQGNATKATNVLSGQSTTSANYDVHGRLVSETDSFGIATTTYSARGFVLKSADESVTTNVVHNAIGLVTEVVTGTGFTLRWTYKPDHTVEAVTINGNALQVASLSTKQKKTLLDLFVSTAVAQSGTIVLPPPSGGIGLRGGGIPGICRAVMHELGRRLVESVSTEDTCGDEKKQCDPCDQVAENLGWTNHGRKHVPKKNMPWPDVVRGTATGDAKYTHNVAANDVAQRAFEMAAWNRGTPSNIRKRWRFMKFDFIVGAKSGVETVYMRVECTDPGVIHGHPVTSEEYRQHVGKL